MIGIYAPIHSMNLWIRSSLNQVARGRSCGESYSSIPPFCDDDDDLIEKAFEIGERHWAPSELEGIVHRRRVFHPSVVQSAGGSGCARDGG